MEKQIEQRIISLCGDNENLQNFILSLYEDNKELFEKYELNDIIHGAGAMASVTTLIFETDHDMGYSEREEIRNSSIMAGDDGNPSVQLQFYLDNFFITIIGLL